MTTEDERIEAEIKIARAAMERSASHDEIVTIDYSDVGRRFLLAECDDWIEANYVDEFWANGPGQDDMAWRVHMRRAD